MALMEWITALRLKSALLNTRVWDWVALPICMAKTHLSLSHDPALKGVPKGFVFPSGMCARPPVPVFFIQFWRNKHDARSTHTSGVYGH